MTTNLTGAPIQDELLRAKRADILRIAEKYGLRSVRVFGSRARDEARSNSDVDFLIEVGTKHIPWFPGALQSDLEDALGCKVDIVTESGLHWYIRKRVLAEAVPL